MNNYIIINDGKMIFLNYGYLMQNPSINYGTVTPPTPPLSTSENIILSHDQYYVTYAGAYDNDTVGTWNPWFVLQDTCTGTFSHSIINNVSSIYALDASGSNGILRINASTNLTARTDTLTIRTTFNGLTQDCSAYIKVMATANCYFIDPTGSSGSGTRVSPYNTYPAFAAGKAYFLKRGTTFTSTIDANVSGTNGNEVIYGSYGTGAKGIINTSGGSAGMYISGNYNQVYELYFNNVLDGIQTATGAVPYTNCLFSHLDFNNTNGNGGLYIKRHGEIGDNTMYHSAYDIISRNNILGHGVKCEGGYNTFGNIRCYDNAGNGFGLPEWGSNNTVSGVSVTGSNQNGIEFNGRYNTLSYSYTSSDQYRGIIVEDPCSYGSTISHCKVAGSSGSSGILVDYTTTQANNIIIEDCEVYNSMSNGIDLRIGSGYTIRRNKIYGNTSYGINLGYSSTSVSDVSIYDNILYHNTTADIYGRDGSNIRVYNNTCDGSINLISTTNETVVNNFYKSLTGEASSHHNLDIDTITQSNYFVDASNHNYHLKSTATLAIGTGTNVGITTDYDGSTFANPPSIGAFEYFTDKD